MPVHVVVLVAKVQVAQSCGVHAFVYVLPKSTQDFQDRHIPPSDNERSRGEPGIGGQTGHIQRMDFNLGGDDLAASGCLDTCSVGQDKLFTE